MSPANPEPDRPADDGRPTADHPEPSGPMDRAAQPGQAPPHDPAAVQDHAAPWDQTAPPPAVEGAGSAYPWSPGGAYPWAPVPPVAPAEPRRPGRTTAVAVGTALVIALLGLPLGLLWHVIAPGVTGTKSGDGLQLPEPEQLIADDGWFTILGFGFGLLVAIVAWLVLRRYRGPVGLVAVVLGTFGATLLAWRLGQQIGLASFRQLARAAPDGQVLHAPPRLAAGGLHRVLGVLPVPYGNLLVPAFASAVMYTLLAGWSKWPSLRPEPLPPPEPGVSWDSPAAPTP